MAAPSADRINARAAKDRVFLKRALKDPGLRSKLDPKYLSAGQQKSRALNTRLNAPITPGSSTTERDLAHAAQAATTVQFGPQEQALGQQLGVAQQTQRDTGSFYDQYQAQLQHHEQMVQAFQAGAQQGLANTAQGITGLAGQDATQLQSMANQQAAQQGVAPAGDMTQLQNQAAATRQALIGSFQAQQALQGANANDYADTQANVVAPGQKLSALAQAAGRTRDVGQKITDLKGQEGAFNEQFRDTRRQDEFKNVLAQQTLTGTQANQAADNAIAATNAKTAQTRVTETTRHNKSAEGIAKTRNKNAAKTAQQKADLAAGKVNQYGYTDAAWRAMSTSQRQKAIKDFKAGGKGAGSGKGPDWQTNAQQGQGASDAVNLKDLANRAKAGTKFAPGPKDRPGTGVKLDRHQAAAKIQQAAHIRDPALLSAALDAVYLVPPRLSRGTIQKLIAAGYKPSKVASALGVPTAGQTTRSGAAPRAGATGSPAAGATTTSSQSRR